MKMQQKYFEIIVENSPTILPKIIQVINFNVIQETDAGKARPIETRLKKLVDVPEIK